MKASEKKSIEQWAARLSDAKLEQAYYDAVYDSLGSQVEEMYDRDYDMEDIREQKSLEKYRSEKAGLLEELCTARGIRLWEERQDAPEDAPVRLIDADKLVKEFSQRVEMYKDERSFSKAAEASAARCIVRTATTVDAVEVVRCKDCRHEGLPTCMICCIEHQELRFINHDPDFYCAYGEREDGEQNAVD